MASGTKQLIVPTRQRLYSSDINRLQQFISADLVEVWDQIALASTFEDNSNGVATYTTTQSNPLYGVILNGLMFQAGTTTANSNVTGGIVIVADPDASPSIDDSPIKYVRDPGSGNLTLTPNSSGSTRIDVVEVSRANSIMETATVDVFNTTLGVFAPQTVTKVIQSNLTYRIRTGANGGGFPGTAQGWLPLAVCSVPTGTTTWDTVAIWDVRPLAIDLLHAPFNTVEYVAKVNREFLQLNTNNTTNNSTLYPLGWSESSLGAWRVGGSFYDPTQPGNPATNLMANTHLAPGVTFGTYHPYAVYLAFPHGLPRWAAYAAYPSARQPAGPRGYLITSNVFPTDASGRPPSTLGMPTGFGFTGSSNVIATNAVCIAAGFCDSIGGNVAPMGSDGRMTYNLGSANIAGANLIASDVNFSLTPGTHFPANARRLRLQFFINATWASGFGTLSALTYDWALPGNVLSTQLIATGLANTNATPGYFAECVIPVPPGGPNHQSPSAFRVGCRVGNVGGLSLAAAANQVVVVCGWDLGP